MSGLRPKRRCNGAGVRPLQLLVRPFGKRAGGGAGSVAVPLKSHTRPKESDRADDALIRWLYRLEQQDKLKVPTLGEVLAHCEWPRDDTLIPMPGGGTISEWCLRDLSAAGERPAGQADEDPTSGGVASATASSTVCRSQTQSLVSGEYNSDEEIECLDSVYMATPETSMPDEQDGADSGPEEGVTVTTIADIHEPRESERRGPTRSIIYLDIAAMTRENRFFVDVRVGPFTYKALLDSGAQCCLAGPRMMRELAERIKPSMSLIGYANQQTQPSGGYLPVMLQIDREAGRIDMECTEILPVEMVLGVDFGRRWRVDISMGRNQWRSGDGPWHNFAKLNEARSMRCDIVAECAGITVCGGEREIIESKIKRLIPDVPPKLGHTDKIVHRIELVEGAKPVCHRTRRIGRRKWKR
ncbi:unnamed protein product [Trichogramma brassicae]|uniref:Uncharacterized protein n=1 Tax=Trichogramma brassicae TaxID=86971 RepID=A0A6H5IQQ4_9HYME|nr:unnamed protein product [Trichogramma brassicae]